MLSKFFIKTFNYLVKICILVLESFRINHFFAFFVVTCWELWLLIGHRLKSRSMHHSDFWLGKCMCAFTPPLKTVKNYIVRKTTWSRIKKLLLYRDAWIQTLGMSQRWMSLATTYADPLIKLYELQNLLRFNDRLLVFFCLGRWLITVFVWLFRK